MLRNVFIVLSPLALLTPMAFAAPVARQDPGAVHVGDVVTPHSPGVTQHLEEALRVLEQAAAGASAFDQPLDLLRSRIRRLREGG